MSRPPRRRQVVATVAVDERAALRTELQRSLNNEQLVQESFAALAAQMAEPGWQMLSAQFEQEFSAEGLRQIRAICRLFAIKNPLIKRALSLRQAYVWGKGAEITARANGRQDDEQDVQAVVDRFLTDPGNVRAFTGSAARERLERCLGTDGEFFPALFTRPDTGEVHVRVVIADEIVEVISNPEDRTEPWYYRRRWLQRILRPDGHTADEQREQFHPAFGYRPKKQPETFGRTKVAWDSPMLHVKVGDLEGWERGVPDAYAAIDWSMAYKVFLEDWARLVKSLSRFAWRMTVRGANRAQAKTRLAAAPPRDASGRPNDVGAVAMTPPDQVFEAIPKSGATIDSESGKPLAAMVAAALDVPLTMLLADPGQTGARAVAETLDKPTELAMGQRRDLWAGVYQQIIAYAISSAVKAPDGPLKGTVATDRYGRETVLLSGNTDPTVDIDWPDLDANSTETVTAVVNAASTGVLPPEQVCRLLLAALGVRRADTILETLLDEDGNFQWPEGPGAVSPNNPADVAAGTGPPSMQPGDALEPDSDDSETTSA